MNWQSTSVNIGAIKQNSSRQIQFTALPTIPEVKEITASCGCTKAKYNKDIRILSVTYKAGYIPNQVTGNQTINKQVVVHYKDGTHDILTISGVKIR